jgi:hypothetical protein
LAAQPWHALGFDEGWGMFVPPPFQGGWNVFRGQTLRGDWVNLLVPENSVDSLSMPAELDQNVPTSRHVLLYNTILSYNSSVIKSKSKSLPLIQESICNNFRLRWEASHTDTLDRIQMLELYKFYREYDSDKGTFSKAEMKYNYKKRIL